MLTVDFKQIRLEEGSRVLDAGCGSGRHLCEAFKAAGVDVVGVDIGWEDLCKARGYLSMMANDMANDSNGNWLVSRAGIEKLPFADGVFDVVVCSEVLEHVKDAMLAATELIRVLKTGGDLVVTVPRFLPERICWAISSAYHQESGGHVRIFKKSDLLALMEDVGARCWRIRYRHSLHSPYWWLKCFVGHKNETFPLVKAYKKFLEWDIIRRPRFTTMLDRLLNPLIGKSMIFYMKKGYR